MDHSYHVIQAKGLNIFREGQAILADLDLSIAKGEFCYLLGGTGSGKSSLLKTLFGALPLHSGQLEVAGQNMATLNVRQMPEFRRKLGMIFQDFRLLEDRSVRDNLDVILRATDWNSKKERNNRIEEVLEWVHLPEKVEKFPHQLSGGERQRVAIARALLNQPQLIIGDEPTGNLDPATSDEILYLLSRLNKEKNTAILLATHDYRLLDKFPGRILKLQAGALLEQRID